MSEEEVSYASVVIKSKKNAQLEAPTEEKTLYDQVKLHQKATEDTNTSGSNEEQAVSDEVKVLNKTSQPTVNTTGKGAEGRLRRYQLLTCCFGLLCIILLLAVIGVCVYFTSLPVSEANELNQLRANQTSLMDENHNLTNLNDKLRSDYEDLRMDHKNLMMQLNNLTQTLTASENKITNLTEENLELETQNQELQMETKNLTDQIINMEATSNDLNVSRAQWSVDAYCPNTNNARTCSSCQSGWMNIQSSCYAYNDPGPQDQKTWEGAQDNCRGKISDLTVITTLNEKKMVNNKIWFRTDIKGYWIGLKAVNGYWTWLDGSILTNQSLVQQPASEGQCVIIDPKKQWSSVSCGESNAWICEKKALTL